MPVDGNASIGGRRFNIAKPLEHAFCRNQEITAYDCRGSYHLRRVGIKVCTSRNAISERNVVGSSRWNGLSNGNVESLDGLTLGHEAFILMRGDFSTQLRSWEGRNLQIRTSDHFYFSHASVAGIA